VAGARAGALEGELSWSFVACHAAHDLWDDEGWYDLSARYLQLARNVGALAALPLALAQRVGVLLHAGEFGAAAPLVEETAIISEESPNGAVSLMPCGTTRLGRLPGAGAVGKRVLELPAGSDVEFGVNLSQVPFDGACGQEQLGRDLRV
jgi:hypothetical protein